MSDEETPAPQYTPLLDVSRRYAEAIVDNDWNACDDLSEEWSDAYSKERSRMLTTAAAQGGQEEEEHGEDPILTVAEIDICMTLLMGASSETGSHLGALGEILMKVGCLVEMGGNPCIALKSIFAIVEQLYRFLVDDRIPHDHRSMMATQLKNITLPGITCFSRAPVDERRKILSDYPHLRNNALAVSQEFGGGAAGNAPTFLVELLDVLYDEELLIIEPMAKVAVLAKISGVSDNLQLLTLVQRYFPAFEEEEGKRGKQLTDSTRGITDTMLSVALGNTKETRLADSEETVMAEWDMMSHEYFGPNGTRRGGIANKDYFVWGEGKPVDVPFCPALASCELLRKEDEEDDVATAKKKTTSAGLRVLVLAPRSYVRSSQSRRSFSGLKASFSIERVFSVEQTAKLMDIIGGGK